jgi:hypothetical protein
VAVPEPLRTRGAIQSPEKARKRGETMADSASSGIPPGSSFLSEPSRGFSGWGRPGRSGRPRSLLHPDLAPRRSDLACCGNYSRSAANTAAPWTSARARAEAPAVLPEGLPGGRGGP